MKASYFHWIHNSHNKVSQNFQIILKVKCYTNFQTKLNQHHINFMLARRELSDDMNQTDFASDDPMTQLQSNLLTVASMAEMKVSHNSCMEEKNLLKRLQAISKVVCFCLTRWKKWTDSFLFHFTHLFSSPTRWKNGQTASYFTLLTYFLAPQDGKTDRQLLISPGMGIKNGKVS